MPELSREEAALIAAMSDPVDLLQRDAEQRGEIARLQTELRHTRAALAAADKFIADRLASG